MGDGSCQSFLLDKFWWISAYLSIASRHWLWLDRTHTKRRRHKISWIKCYLNKISHVPLTSIFMVSNTLIEDNQELHSTTIFLNVAKIQFTRSRMYNNAINICLIIMNQSVRKWCINYNCCVSVKQRVAVIRPPFNTEQMTGGYVILAAWMFVLVEKECHQHCQYS